MCIARAGQDVCPDVEETASLICHPCYTNKATIQAFIQLAALSCWQCTVWSFIQIAALLLAMHCKIMRKQHFFGGEIIAGLSNNHPHWRNSATLDKEWIAIPRHKRENICLPCTWQAQSTQNAMGCHKTMQMEWSTISHDIPILALKKSWDGQEKGKARTEFNGALSLPCSYTCFEKHAALKLQCMACKLWKRCALCSCHKRVQAEAMNMFSVDLQIWLVHVEAKLKAEKKLRDWCIHIA